MQPFKVTPPELHFYGKYTIQLSLETPGTEGLMDDLGRPDSLGVVLCGVRGGSRRGGAGRGVPVQAGGSQLDLRSQFILE